MGSAANTTAGIAAAIAILTTASPAFAQQPYPHKPIRAIVPYAPGGTADLVGQGLEPYITTPAEFGALMRSELAKYAKIIGVANIKLESG